MSESSSEESLPSHSSLLSTWTAVPSLVMVSLTSVLTTKLVLFGGQDSGNFKI